VANVKKKSIVLGHKCRPTGSGRTSNLPIQPEVIVTVAASRAPRSGDAGKQAIGHWTGYAACHVPGVDPELFFPLADAGPALPRVAAAKRICAGCPVRVNCLGWALRAGEPAGIWGGTTPEERRGLRRAQGR
jgi:WhiB family redox-sensing transcriptional regulator